MRAVLTCCPSDVASCIRVSPVSVTHPVGSSRGQVRVGGVSHLDLRASFSAWTNVISGTRNAIDTSCRPAVTCTHGVSDVQQQQQDEGAWPTARGRLERAAVAEFIDEVPAKSGGSRPREEIERLERVPLPRVSHV